VWPPSALDDAVDVSAGADQMIGIGPVDAPHGGVVGGRCSGKFSRRNRGVHGVAAGGRDIEHLPAHAAVGGHVGEAVVADNGLVGIAGRDGWKPMATSP